MRVLHVDGLPALAVAGEHVALLQTGVKGKAEGVAGGFLASLPTTPLERYVRLIPAHDYGASVTVRSPFRFSVTLNPMAPSNGMEVLRSGISNAPL